ncbi:hypothetical protein NTE_02842 [Candidatus Nitrososphaera evergladensis SR1]|uniref:Uncharacterized protein n=1 Tax=Candidatus Nitrososphaera evergladensis SR1 TaxID=1459636 RepID=A0A075MUI8_9ARCH|nr:hypothetical protein [Candidatus Nitrososphaera evergladensis]AIF84880.1 hypothetical protein NTE_02842 [Candidatus Nitrososphaera evergladensis SR1]
MERKSTTALLLAAMMVGGLAYASAGQQRAFAHNFSGDESAAFLANVDTLKIHLMLVGGNYVGNHDSARQHAEHAAEHLSAATIKEIAERNQRLGTDLPAALGKLKTSVEGNSPRSEIVQQIKDINGLLGETVAARIDKSQLTNSTVNALVFADLVNEILESYQGAYGVMEEGDHDHSSGSMNMTGSSSSAMEEGAHDKVVNMPAYQSARWLALKASSMYYKLSAVAPAGSEASMAKLRSGLDELKNAVDGQSSLEAVTVIVHGKVHQNLMDAFSLPMEEEGSSSDHDQETEISGNMTGNMTGSMEGNMTQ